MRAAITGGPQFVMVSEAPILRESGAPSGRAFRPVGWESNHLNRAKRILSDYARPGVPSKPGVGGLGWGAG